MVAFGQSGCILAKVIVFAKKGLYLGKVVVFVKVVSFGLTWLFSWKVVLFGQK